MTPAGRRQEAATVQAQSTADAGLTASGDVPGRGLGAAALASGPGTYVLVLHTASRARVQVGRRGPLRLVPGYYLYVGSAFGPGGLRARVTRHCRADKRAHWHIDYLRPHADPVAVWYSHASERLEHRWACALQAMPGVTTIAGFGCSDCGCATHLFHLPVLPDRARFARSAGVPVLAGACPSAG